MNSSSESIVVGEGVLRGAKDLLILLRLLTTLEVLTRVASAIRASADFLFRV